MSTSTKTSPEDGLSKEFFDLVNMTATQLEHWLETDESRAVGQTKTDGGEAIGHKSGREIVLILKKKHGADFTDSEMTQMKRTVSYIKRHLAQRPHGKDLEHTRWTESLKNWGHDPLK